MKKFLGYTTIFVLLGILFFSFNNMFVEQEKEVIVEKETEQTSLVNIYLVELDKQNIQTVIPVKRKIMKGDIYTNRTSDNEHLSSSLYLKNLP